MSHVTPFRRTIPIYISSNSEYGGINKNSTNNEITFNLDPAIVIPPQYNGSIRLISSNIWYSVPNISAPLYNNDTLRISNDGVNWTNIVFPTGLYDIPSINDYLSDWFVNNNLDNNLIVFDGVEATGHIQVSLNNATIRIDWDNSNIATILGWTNTSGIIGPAAIVGTTYTSPNTANLNSLESILIHCSICSGSYLGIKGGNDVIGLVSPNVGVGELIMTRDIHLVDVDINTRNISQIRFRLTDQNNNTIDLSAEDWSFLIEIVMTPK